METSTRAGHGKKYSFPLSLHALILGCWHEGTAADAPKQALDSELVLNLQKNCGPCRYQVVINGLIPSNSTRIANRP
jgi:hypothetical protein